MPLPTPNKDEEHDDFISRCMADATANEEFPDEKQRNAVCEKQWDKDKSSVPEGCEVRTCQGIELREVEGDGGPIISGYAAVFDKMSVELWGFRETIAPGAFTDTLKSGDDVRSLVNHDSNQRLGRTSNGTVRINEDKIGLKFDIDPPNTSVGRDTVEDIRNGNLDGMSFMFKTINDKWETKDGEEVRTLMEVELIEGGPVTFPAYPDTTVALRALEKRTAERNKKEETSEESSKDESGEKARLKLQIEEIDRRTTAVEHQKIANTIAKYM